MLKHIIPYTYKDYRYYMRNLPVTKNNKYDGMPRLLFLSELKKNMFLTQDRNTKYKFLLTRHAESMWNKDDLFTGWRDVPLTKTGIMEANKMGSVLVDMQLFPNIIFTSSLSRAILTSNIIKEKLDNNSTTKSLVCTSWRLNESYYGHLEGTYREDVRKLFGLKYTNYIRTNFTSHPPMLNNILKNNDYPLYQNYYLRGLQRGESKEQLLRRMLPYYRTEILSSLSNGAFPLIVTHKHTCRVLMKHLLKLTDDEFVHYDMPDKQMLLIHLDASFNYVNHFDLPSHK